MKHLDLTFRFKYNGKKIGINLMKKTNNSKLSFFFATIGLILSCINLLISEFEGTSVALFCSLIAIWICNVENYKKNNNTKS